MSAGVKTLNLRFMALTAVTVRCRQGEQMGPTVKTCDRGGALLVKVLENSLTLGYN